jgi:hypothetical protein
VTGTVAAAMGARSRVAVAGLVLATGLVGCGSPPTTTHDPAALPLDFAILWDVPGSTSDHGVGPYFDTPSSPRLNAGPVIVSWWCRGSGTLEIAPGQVAHPPELPGPDAPLAFRVRCPTRGDTYSDWSRLAVDATGGENAIGIRAVDPAGGAISYRLLFAQSTR